MVKIKRTWNEEDEPKEKAESIPKKREEAQCGEINNIERQPKNPSSVEQVSKSSVFPVDHVEPNKADNVNISIERGKTSTMYHSMIPTVKKQMMKNPVNNIQNVKEPPKGKKLKTKTTSTNGQIKVISSTPDPANVGALKAAKPADMQPTRQRHPKKRVLRSEYENNYSTKKFTPKRYKNRHRIDRYEKNYPNYRIKYYPDKPNRKDSPAERDANNSEHVKKFNSRGEDKPSNSRSKGKKGGLSSAKRVQK